MAWGRCSEPVRSWASQELGRGIRERCVSWQRPKVDKGREEAEGQRPEDFHLLSLALVALYEAWFGVLELFGALDVPRVSLWNPFTQSLMTKRDKAEPTGRKHVLLCGSVHTLYARCVQSRLPGAPSFSHEVSCQSMLQALMDHWGPPCPSSPPFSTFLLVPWSCYPPGPTPGPGGPASWFQPFKGGVCGEAGRGRSGPSGRNPRALPDIAH